MTGKRENRAAGQDRLRNGQFGSGYSDEKLYKLVEAVITTVDPVDPLSVSERRFSKEAPAIAEAKGWPKPPQGHAITQRLRKPWKQIKEEATQERSIQQVLARSDGVKMAPWLDERFVFFALRRIHLHLQKTAQQTLYPHEYVRGRNELLAAARRHGGLETMAEQLPTVGQIMVLYDNNWDEPLRLAGLPKAEPVERALARVTIAEHFYETKERFPSTIKELRVHAEALKIAFPWRSMGSNIAPTVTELIADRAARGLETPASGPVEGARLSPEEIDQLIADAPPRRPWRDWSWIDAVIDAFADFVEEFDGKEKITNKLYNAYRAQRGWPANTAWSKYGRFQEMVDKGRERARERRQAAA